MSFAAGEWKSFSPDRADRSVRRAEPPEARWHKHRGHIAGRPYVGFLLGGLAVEAGRHYPNVVFARFCPRMRDTRTLCRYSIAKRPVVGEYRLRALRSGRANQR